jgi:hypothetical protein
MQRLTQWRYSTFDNLVRTEVMVMRKILCLVAFTIGISGCAGMSESQQRMTTGTMGGAAGGALIGAIAGNAGMGAAIGAGAGLLGGYLYDQHKKSEQRAYQQGYQQGRQNR